MAIYKDIYYGLTQLEYWTKFFEIAEQDRKKENKYQKKVRKLIEKEENAKDAFTKLRYNNEAIALTDAIIRIQERNLKNMVAFSSKHTEPCKTISEPEHRRQRCLDGEITVTELAEIQLFNFWTSMTDIIDYIASWERKPKKELIDKIFIVEGITNAFVRIANLVQEIEDDIDLWKDICPIANEALECLEKGEYNGIYVLKFAEIFWFIVGGFFNKEDIVENGKYNIPIELREEILCMSRGKLRTFKNILKSWKKINELTFTRKHFFNCLEDKKTSEEKSSEYFRILQENHLLGEVSSMFFSKLLKREDGKRVLKIFDEGLNEYKNLHKDLNEEQCKTTLDRILSDDSVNLENIINDLEASNFFKAYRHPEMKYETINFYLHYGDEEKGSLNIYSPRAF